MRRATSHGAWKFTERAVYAAWQWCFGTLPVYLLFVCLAALAGVSFFVALSGDLSYGAQQGDRLAAPWLYVRYHFWSPYSQFSALRWSR